MISICGSEDIEWSPSDFALEWLVDEGYRPWESDDRPEHPIVFEAEGRECHIRFPENDELIVLIMYLTDDELLEDEDSFADVLRVANKINLEQWLLCSYIQDGRRLIVERSQKIKSDKDVKVFLKPASFGTSRRRDNVPYRDPRDLERRIQRQLARIRPR